MLSLEPKRKRGRPRKGEEKNLLKNPSYSSAVSPKRKRGRPRKYNIDESQNFNQGAAEEWDTSVEPEIKIEEPENESEILRFTEEEDHQFYQAETDKGTQEVNDKMLLNKMCDICGNVFQEFQPEKGKKIKNKRDQLTTCETCSYYVSPHLMDVENINTNLNEYRCEECSKSFVRKDGLERHKAIHSDVKLFSCKLCTKSFKRSDKLTEHLRIAHLEVKDEVKRRLETMCEVCGNLEDVIAVPISVNENDTTTLNICEACNMTRPDQISALATDSEEGKLFQCDICSREFSRKDHVSRHRLTHLDLKPFECYLCHKSFTRNDRLLRHMRSHPEAKPFSCRICSESFATRKEERDHIQTTHPRGTYKPEICQVCHKEFRDKGKLQRHLVTHTDHKGHTCKVCGRGFKLLESLLLHQQIHSDYKPYECEYCGLTYKVRETYKRHLLVHTTDIVYQCTECPKTFRRKDKLKSHSLSHGDVRSFSCETCNTAFKRRDGFNSHCRTVHGWDPVSEERVEKLSTKKKVKTKEEGFNFTCGVCDEALSSLSDLTKHVMVHN